MSPHYHHAHRSTIDRSSHIACARQHRDRRRHSAPARLGLRGQPAAIAFRPIGSRIPCDRKTLTRSTARSDYFARTCAARHRLTRLPLRLRLLIVIPRLECSAALAPGGRAPSPPRTPQAGFARNRGFGSVGLCQPRLCRSALQKPGCWPGFRWPSASYCSANSVSRVSVTCFSKNKNADKSHCDFRFLCGWVAHASGPLLGPPTSVSSKKARAAARSSLRSHEESDGAFLAQPLPAGGPQKQGPADRRNAAAPKCQSRTPTHSVSLRKKKPG